MFDGITISIKGVFLPAEQVLPFCLSVEVVVSSVDMDISQSHTGGAVIS
jgi:hypothetical protein